ncbi:hypothetical protein [Mobiluncus mulieris]|uniref:hypothetical protein n=1 Tax=Mobiluncus mulieris TaxID=2052 RepID=UPI002092B7C2|nr:hypothetical protein [Mobiluncus mulieris]
MPNICANFGSGTGYATVYFVNVVGDVTGVKQRIQKVLDPYYVFTVMAPRELAAVTAAPTANIVLVMHALLGSRW